MNELAKLMVRSGVLTEEQVAQFKKWGMAGLEGNGEPLESAHEFMREVEMALQKEEMVLVRETDFSALHDYLKKQRQGTLFLDTGETSTEAAVSYTLAKTGEYLLPWNGENVADLLANGLTYLMTDQNERVSFYEVRELYYGDIKAFVVCRPLPTPPPETAVDPDTTTPGPTLNQG